jgi:DNA-binding MarR family transcriptional regulator
MSTANLAPVSPALADTTIAFMSAFGAWLKRASLETAGESVARVRLLNELHCNGPQKMADLAEALGVTPRAITAMVDTLEADDQVRRTAHPSDRRITMVEITGGRASVEAQFEAIRTQVEALFADVDPADLAAYQRVVSQALAKVSG